MKAYVWPGDAKGDVTMGAEYETREIPADLQAKAEEYRAELIEAVAESSEELMEKYLEGEELTIDELKAGIRQLTINGEAFPRALWFRIQEPWQFSPLAGCCDRVPALPPLGCSRCRGL